MQILFTSIHATCSFARDISIKAFSSSSILYQNDEPRYLIAGLPVSVADIRDMKAENRTVAHWRTIVDWDIQAQRPYVIIDPYDPRGLLYLSRGEYLLQSRVSLHNELTLIVVARPGDKPPTPISQNSPSSPKGVREPFKSSVYFQNRANRLTWKEFKRLRHFAQMNVKMVDGMVSVSPKSIERAVIVWTRQLFHYSGVTAPERRLSSLFSLTRVLRSNLTNNGLPFVCKRLKIGLFAVYCYLSGNPLASTDALGLRVGLAHGLPRYIPKDMRLLIRSGDLKWIRIWVSILNIYRALKVKLPDPETAYETIRKPLPTFVPNFSYDKFVTFARYVFPELVRKRAQASDSKFYNFQYRSRLGEIIRSAGANLRSSIGLFSIILDAKAWNLRGARNYVRQWFVLMNDPTAAILMDAISQESHFPLDLELFDRMVGFYPTPPVKTPEEKQKLALKLANLLEEARSEGTLSSWVQESWKLAREVRFADIPIVGRLFNFGAPGGKLRTVAICDYWTQIAMKPVHDYLFDLLKLLGCNDATFDQQGRVDAYWAKAYKPHWSYDLSAATDSIPIYLYIQTLAPFFMDKDRDYNRAYEKALLWSKVLTEREFGLPSPKKGERFHGGTRLYRFIRYMTGQPMGAYSSWASMALVHHALVQFAHWVKCECPHPRDASWFESYLVLGDDVDISRDENVALTYTQVCSDFQVKIGLAKSLKSSSNFFEFANQRLCEAGNISPLSFLEEITSKTWRSRVEFAHRISKRFSISVSAITLFRLVTSARQWTFLIPELSGMRDQVLLKFLRFILLGPLRAVWHSENTVSIESITKWLQSLNEELLEPVMTRQRVKKVDLLLSKAVLDKVEQLIEANHTKLLKQPPKAPQASKPLDISKPSKKGAFLLPGLAAFKQALEITGFSPLYTSKVVTLVDRSQHSEKFLTALSRLNVSAWSIHMLQTYFCEFNVRKIRVPKRCAVSYLYILNCAHMHNERCRKDWLAIRVEFAKLLKEWKARDVPAALFAASTKGKPSPLPQIIELYWKASSLPQTIDLSDGITSAAFGIKSAVRPQDFACILVNEITPIIAKWTGKAVTNLPVLPVGGRGLNPKAFKGLLAFYKRMSAVTATKWPLKGLIGFVKRPVPPPTPAPEPTASIQTEVPSPQVKSPSQKLKLDQISQMVGMFGRRK